MGKFENVFSKIIDIPILFACIFSIGVLIFVFYHSLFGLMDLFKHSLDIRGKMLFAGLLLAVAHAVMYFIEMFVHGFAKTYNHLFNKEKEVKK